MFIKHSPPFRHLNGERLAPRRPLADPSEMGRPWQQRSPRLLRPGMDLWSKENR